MPAFHAELFEAWPAHVHRRRVLDQALLLGVAVEARHRAQPPGDRRPRPAPGLEIAGERLDVQRTRWGRIRPSRHPQSGARSDRRSQLHDLADRGRSEVAPGLRAEVGRPLPDRGAVELAERCVTERRPDVRAEVLGVSGASARPKIGHRRPPPRAPMRTRGVTRSPSPAETLARPRRSPRERMTSAS